MNHEEIIDYYKHKHSTDEGFSRGSALTKHIPRIAQYIQTFKLSSILDYGCGKGIFWKTTHPVVLRSIFEWADRKTEIVLYDPAILEHSALPDKRFDLVICTDVLEHVLEEKVPETLDAIISRARKMVYLNISTKKATKHFPDGTNLHITVRDRKWWLNQINESEKRMLKEHKQYVSIACFFDDE